MDTELAQIEQEINVLTGKLQALKREISKVIIGQEDTIDQLLITFLAGGHALLEGVPGLAKTLMIRTLADAIDLDFKRIQFTPDLMPSDIIGTEILEEDHSTGRKFFKFNKGPIFANIILADEINRTPPKTQAALLEAMQEFEVTYSGKTYTLDRPISGDDILRLQHLVREVPISDDLIDYVSKVVRATRPETTTNAYVKEWVSWGAGPRAGQAMILTAKARALLDGRLAVTLDDLKQVAIPVLRHRIIINFKGEAEGIDSDNVTQELLKTLS